MSTVALSEAIRVVEGLIVGDAARQIPDPELGVTLGKNLFLGSRLNTDQFLIPVREVVVYRPLTRKATGQDREDKSAPVDDTIMVEWADALPTDGTDQRDARDGAYDLDTRIRGAVLTFNETEPRDLSIFYVQTTERGALSSQSVGYGSFNRIVLLSTYRLRRIESLTGGS